MDAADINRSIFNEEAASYDHKHRKLNERLTRELQARLDFIGVDWASDDEDTGDEFEEGGANRPRREVRMLDYACGTGMMSRAIAPYTTQCVGMDVSEKMVAAYNARAENQGLLKREMHAIVGDLTAPTVSQDLMSSDLFDFDIAVVGGGLHHFADPELAAKRLVERLKPNGVFLIWDFLPHAPFRHDEDNHRPNHDHGNNKGFSPHTEHTTTTTPHNDALSPTPADGHRAGADHRSGTCGDRARTGGGKHAAEQQPGGGGGGGGERPGRQRDENGDGDGDHDRGRDPGRPGHGDGDEGDEDGREVLEAPDGTQGRRRTGDSGFFCRRPGTGGGARARAPGPHPEPASSSSSSTCLSPTCTTTTATAAVSSNVPEQQQQQQQQHVQHSVMHHGFTPERVREIFTAAGAGQDFVLEVIGGGFALGPSHGHGHGHGHGHEHRQEGTEREKGEGEEYSLKESDQDEHVAREGLRRQVFFARGTKGKV